MKTKTICLYASLAIAAIFPLTQTFGVAKDGNSLVFLSDIHVGADKRCEFARMMFATVVDEILAMRPLPGNVIVFGDVAYASGKGEDYDLSRPLFKKLEDAGIAVTIGMGNHDRRSEYAKRWPEAAARSLVPGRYVHLVETRHVDFLMLDTLQGLDERPSADEGPQGGALSKEEQVFLQSFLAGRRKPVIVCAHHPSSDLWCCGSRFDEFLRTLPMVAGYINGHFHRWWLKSEREICLPSAASWGDVGYALCRCHPDRVEIESILKGFSIPTLAGNPLMTSAHPGERNAIFTLKHQ